MAAEINETDSRQLCRQLQAARAAQAGLAPKLAAYDLIKGL